MFQGQMDAGAVAGLGPKQGMAQQQKVYQDYVNQSKGIDDYMSQLGLGVASNAQQNALSGMAGLSQGPNSQAIPWQQSAAGGDGGAGLMGTLGGMIGGMGGGGGMFGGSKMATPNYGGGIIGSQGPQGNAFSQYKPASGGFNFPTPGSY